MAKKKKSYNLILYELQQEALREEKLKGHKTTSNMALEKQAKDEYLAPIRNANPARKVAQQITYANQAGKRAKQLNRNTKTTNKDGSTSHVKQSIQKVGHVAKSFGSGILSGLSGILEAGTTEVANNLSKGQDDDYNVMDSIKYLLNPTIGMQMKMSESIQDSVKILGDKEKTGLQKATGFVNNAVTDALSIIPGKDIIDQTTQIVGHYSPENAGDTVMQASNKVTKPVYDLQQDLYEEGQQYGGTTQVLGSAAGSVGRMIPSAVATAITKNPTVGLGVMGLSVKGSSTTEALQKGAELNEAVEIGNTKAVIETGIEMLSGGVNIFGKGALDDIVTKGIDRKVKNEIANYFAQKGAGIGMEVIEEVLTDVLNTTVDKGTVDPDAKYTLEDMDETAIVTILSTIGINALTGGYGKASYQNNVARMQQNQKEAQIQGLQQELAKKTEELNKSQDAREKQIIQETINGLNEELNELTNAQQITDEKELRKQNFTYEAQENDSEIKKAIYESASQVMNNTEKAHKFVDVVAKIADEKGTVYKFTNNEQLKQLGYAKEGMTVNGLVNENGEVLINIDSAKELNTVVGHETTHLLEGTKEYEALKQVAIEYAKTKGDYDARIEKLTKLYEGTNADIETELTSDIVGDYLFTDENFVKELSIKQPTVFEKIRNFISDLVVKFKGTDQEKQLRQLQRTFEKAYKAQGTQTSTDTKYSVSDNQGRTLTKEQQEYFKDSKARDKDGNLVTVYHGTMFGGFTEFSHEDPSIGNYRFGDANVNFFTSNKSMAVSYSDAEPYEAEKIKTPKLSTMEDVNRVIADKNQELYEANREFNADYSKDNRLSLKIENGGLTLYDENKAQHTFKNETDAIKNINSVLRDLYGGGENSYGESYYEGYLNITNPYIVDAKGSNWRFVDREFSQELYNKFNSLTQTEKDYLIDLSEWEDYGLFKDALEEANKTVNVQNNTSVGEETKAYASVYKRLVGDLPSQYLKDLRMNDIYTVVLDDFSDKAINLVSMVNLTTNDIVQKALADGSYDGVIIKNVVDYGSEVIIERPGDLYVTLGDSNQFKNVDNTEPTTDPDIRYSLSEDTKGRKLSKEQIERYKYISDKLKDENGNLKVYYHGTQRADRVGTLFDPNRATSGPMAFFTDSEEIATNYSTNKSDTSLSREYDTEYDLFKVDGQDLDSYWNSLSYAEKQKINKEGNNVGFDDDWESIVYGENASENSFSDMYKWYLKNEANGNGIKALYQVWIQDGNIMDDDLYKFQEVLEKAGIKNVEFLDPYKTDSKVYETYLNIKNPFDTSDMSEDIINQFKEASKTATIGEQYSADAWDKSNIAPEDWIAKLENDLEEGTTHAWTVIPDWVTDVLKANGYDGIVDTGGKNGGASHQVAIPFYSEQVKDVNNQKPTDNPNIDMSLSAQNEEIAPTGNWHVKGEDVRLQVEEAIAPLQETIANLTEQVKTMQESFAPTSQDIVEKQGQEAFNHITDEQAPSWEDAVFEAMDSGDFEYSSTEHVPSPLDSRDIDEVGNRKIKAYQYENPEVKPFFQEEAQNMLYDLDNTIKGERIATQDEEGYITGWAGITRQTTEAIAYLKDNYGYSYDQIRQGLNKIIEDDGKENNAVSKRIEFMLDERLREGYTTSDGIPIPANEDYINFLNEKQVTEYNKEAFNAITDEDMPLYEAIEPLKSSTTRESTPSQQTTSMKIKTAQNGNTGLTETVLEPELVEGKKRRWVGTSTESEVVNREVLPDDLDYNAVYYQPITNKDTLNTANSKLNGLGYEESVKYFKNKILDKRTTVEDIALGERLIQEAIKKGDTKTAGDIIQDVAILGTELGQKVQALSIIQRMTPEGQLKMLEKTINRGKTKGDQAFTNVKLTDDMKKKILDTYNKDGSYDQNKLNKAVDEVKQQIADQMPSTLMDKVNAWRYLSMLGNPKTHIRNLVSNVAMKGTVAVKNALARTVEGGTNQAINTINKTFNTNIAPIDRTRTWKAASEDISAFAKQITLEMKDVISGDSKYSEAADIKEKRKIFKTKILEKVANLNSDLLGKEDWWFSKGAFESSFREFLTANGIETQQDIKNNPELIEKGKQYALEQSQIATFRQYSWLSNKIRDIESKNAATQIAVGAVLPFKKTPINIAKTGLSYSPLGFAKTLTYDIAQVKKYKQTNGEQGIEASTLIDHIAQNTTGTALTLVGYMLAQAGFLNGAGDDDKEGKYDYQLGKQAYSINIDGSTYSLSWLSPVAMPLFVGTNMYEQLVEGEEWNADVVLETLGQTLDPLSEMSFLSSLDSVLSSYDSGVQRFFGIGEAMVQNYATQFAPTLMSQIAATKDDTKRSTKVSGDSTMKVLEETYNKLIYKIPGLRETLEPTTDIWGNEIKQSENLFTRAFENFIAPYARKDSIATEIDEELKDLYGQTGDTGLLPSIPSNYVKYDGERYDMSAEEYTDYKKMYGQTANDLLEDLFRTTTYQRATSEERADMVNDVYDYARDEAKLDYLSKEGVDYTNATEDKVEVYKENLIKGAIENDMSVEEYGLYVEDPEEYKFLMEKDYEYRRKYFDTNDSLKEIDESFTEQKEGIDDDDELDALSSDKKASIVDKIINSGLEDTEKASLYKKYYNSDTVDTIMKSEINIDDYLVYETKEFKADKNAKGNSIPGSRKEKVINYVNTLDMEIGQKAILIKSTNTFKFNDYNAQIVRYLDGLGLEYDDFVSILKDLDMTVKGDTVYWE